MSNDAPIITLELMIVRLWRITCLACLTNTPRYTLSQVTWLERWWILMLLTASSVQKQLFEKQKCAAGICPAPFKETVPIENHLAKWFLLNTDLSEGWESRHDYLKWFLIGTNAGNGARHQLPKSCWPIKWKAAAWSDMTWPELNWPDLIWPDLMWNNLRWPELTWPN